MDSGTTQSKPSPDREDVIPETYAVYVTDGRIDVWQYRVDISEPEGEWSAVETLDRDDDPKLSLDHATPEPPTAEGYWIYSKSYACNLDCE